MDTLTNGAAVTPLTAIKINKRDLTIAYQIDRKSSYDLAKEYNITHDEMKATIRTAGLVVRKNEIKSQEDQPTYSVVLVDGDNESVISC